MRTTSKAQATMEGREIKRTKKTKANCTGTKSVKKSKHGQNTQPQKQTRPKGDNRKPRKTRKSVHWKCSRTRRQWTMAVTPQVGHRNETMELLLGDKTTTGLRVEGLIISPHERQAETECVVGDRELQGAIQWGRDMGGCLLGWVPTHSNHVPLLSAQDVCSTNTLGILLTRPADRPLQKPVAGLLPAPPPC